MRESVRNPDRFWAKHGKRIDWFKPYTKVKNTSFDGKVSIKWFEDGSAQRLLQLHRPPSEEARRPGRDHLGRRQPLRRPEDHLQRTLRACLPPRQRAEEARRQEGRPRHHLHADDPRGGLCDARLHPHRRRSIRWCSAASRRTALAGRIDDCKSTFVITADEGLRGGKTIPLKDNTDKAIEIAAKRRRRGEEGAGRAPHRRQDRLGRGPRPLVPPGDRDASRPSASRRR